MRGRACLGWTGHGAVTTQDSAIRVEYTWGPRLPPKCHRALSHSLCMPRWYGRLVMSCWVVDSCSHLGSSLLVHSMDAEHEARVALAACYRLVAKLGLDDLIYNHISMGFPCHGDQLLS